MVSFSGVVVDREVLSIDHGGGYVSSFEPVESELEVGDSVTEGQTVAELSTYDDGSHHCDSPCLHWGVRLFGEYINPLLLIGELEPSVLLPLHTQEVLRPVLAESPQKDHFKRSLLPGESN